MYFLNAFILYYWFFIIFIKLLQRDSKLPSLLFLNKLSYSTKLACSTLFSVHLRTNWLWVWVLSFKFQMLRQFRARKQVSSLLSRKRHNKNTVVFVVNIIILLFFYFFILRQCIKILGFSGFDGNLTWQNASIFEGSFQFHRMNVDNLC